MKTAGIVIETWKLPAFKRNLDAAGYSYTERPVADGTMFLKVQTDQIDGLVPVLQRALRECAQ